MKPAQSVLVTSAEYDKNFFALCEYLEQCSKSMQGCENCSLVADCQRYFDQLMNEATHYKITDSAIQEFMTRFKGMSKQLSLISN